MGRVGQLAVSATQVALKDAGMSESDWQSIRCGIAYGSTQGSSQALIEFATQIMNSGGGLNGVRPTNYIKFMSHTCAANLGTFFGVRGRIVTTCSACTSGSQGVGFGYESIKYGMQDIMIAGGAEELHYTHAGVFDLLRATSTLYNDRPDATPRPFDKDRDGLVVAEGAATLILEEWEHAKKRDATIYAEVLGYGTTCDGAHMTSPQKDGMASAMAVALADARIPATQIDYINAHATGTQIGDYTESHATLSAIGDKTPISSTKGITGHALGAAGSLESVISILALREQFLPKNYNLETLDPECAKLNYVLETESRKLKTVMNNNFAFGGVNTSLIFGLP
jgi:3-oxoacyl-[acyl-carrier-protein] synthase II